MERLTQRNGKYIEYSDENYNDSIDNRTMLEKCLYKLAEYEDAEEQGLLLRLPCKDRTTVYVITDDCDYTLGYCRRKMTCKTCEYRNLHIEQETLTLPNIVLRMSDFGETIFLTQAEAKQKLKEMESD